MFAATAELSDRPRTATAMKVSSLAAVSLPAAALVGRAGAPRCAGIGCRCRPDRRRVVPGTEGVDTGWSVTSLLGAMWFVVGDL